MRRATVCIQKMICPSTRAFPINDSVLAPAVEMESLLGIVLCERASFVAQVSNLLYRGFPIRRCSTREGRSVRVFGDLLCGRVWRGSNCRLEAGDTAGWKPALPKLAFLS